MINHMSTFKETVANFETMEVKYDDEDLGFILLCSLPSLYSNFRETTLYSRDTLTLEKVYEYMRSKETMKQLVNGYEDKAKGLVARGRFHEKGFGNSDRGKSKSKTRNKSCKYCKKKRHAIDDCYKLQNKNKAAANKKGKKSINSSQVSVVEDDHSDGELLAISDSDSKPYEE